MYQCQAWLGAQGASPSSSAFLTFWLYLFHFPVGPTHMQHKLHTDSYYHVNMTILGSLNEGATIWAWSIEEMLMCSAYAHVQGGEGTAVEMNGYPSIHL